MRLSVRHVTRYTYSPAAERLALRLRVFPSAFEGQAILRWGLSVNGDAIAPLLTTGFGDREALWTPQRACEEVEIVAEGEIDTVDKAGAVRGLREAARPGVFLRETPLTVPDDAIRAFAATIAGEDALTRLHALCRAVGEAVAYTPGATSSTTSAAAALKQGAGVCQDQTHVFIAASRAMGLPARYVVGYLFDVDGRETQTHAWAEAYANGLGWIGFDSTNQLCPTDRYVRLCSGLDAYDAAPLRGNVSGRPEETLSASVDIAQHQQ